MASAQGARVLRRTKSWASSVGSSRGGPGLEADRAVQHIWQKPVLFLPKSSGQADQGIPTEPVGQVAEMGGKPMFGAGFCVKADAAGLEDSGLPEDRKSTRLNSSHVKISY